MKNVLLRLCAVVLLSGMFSSSFAVPFSRWQDKVDPILLEDASNGQTVEFLVVLSEQADLTFADKLSTKTAKGRYVFQTLQATACATQGPVLQLLQEAGVKYQSFYIVNAIYSVGDISLIQQLAEMDEVAQIVKNAHYEMERVLDAHLVGSGQRGPTDLTWGLKKIGIDSVWAMGIRGQGVVLAGQDTGYDWTNPALQGNYRGWDGTNADHNYNWHDAIHQPDDTTQTNPCGFDMQHPCDDNNHGTHTMGTMQGNIPDNPFGVAPEAKWIGCRNMNQGNGSLNSYVECFEWFIAPTNLQGENPDPDKSPMVINNSWYCSTGEGCDTSNFYIMNQAVNNTKAAGIVVVVSVGNAGPNCSSATGPPGFFEESFSIGATADNDSIANFSSRGAISIDNSFRTKPNVSAPGVGVLSCILNNGLAYFSGTSMSGPHVVGTVALMISANPAIAGHVDVIEDILEQTAVPLFDAQECNGLSYGEIPNNAFGYGRIDAFAAVKAAQQWVPPVIPFYIEGPPIDTSRQFPVVTGTDPMVPVALNWIPNPFQTRLTLTATGLQGECKLKIFDSAGRLMQHQSWANTDTHTFMLDTSAWPSGVYFYQIMHNGTSITGKLQKS